MGWAAKNPSASGLGLQATTLALSGRVACSESSVAQNWRELTSPADPYLEGQRWHASSMSPKACPVTIDVPKLRRVLDALLDQVQRTKGSLIEIDRDHYWLLELTAAFSEDLREPGTRPGDLGVGQISDDVATVNELAKEIETGDAFLNPWHDLEHAVGLLRALASKDLPYDGRSGRASL